MSDAQTILAILDKMPLLEKVLDSKITIKPDATGRDEIRALYWLEMVYSEFYKPLERVRAMTNESEWSLIFCFIEDNRDRYEVKCWNEAVKNLKKQFNKEKLPKYFIRTPNVPRN